MSPSYNNTTSNATGDDFACVVLTDPPDVILSHQISMFASLLFVIIGIIGNCLSMVVFTYKGMRTVSSNTYLFVLAVSDSLYLVSVFFGNIIKTMRCFYFHDTALDITNRSSILCQLCQYFLDFFSDYSTCLILVFTIERCVAVYLPMRFKQMCTVLKARLTCFGVFLFIAIFIAPYHFLFMGKYMDEEGEEFNVCTIRNKAYEKKFTIMYIVEMLFFRILPVIVIAVLNVFIIIKVTKVARYHRKRKSANSKAKASKKDEKNLQLTIMLILVSTSYVLAYLPVLIHFVLSYLQRSEIIDLSANGMLIAGNYTRTLYIAGFAINFFLYTVSGRVFREQLKVIMKCSSDPHGKNGYLKSTAETEALTCKVKADHV